MASTRSRAGLPRAFLASATVAILLLPAFARAGAQRPCTRPSVYRSAAVNTFVLPYRYDGVGPSLDLDRASRQISALVHLEILFSILKYGAVGGTDLVAVPGHPCDVGEVIGEVTRSGGTGSLEEGQTLVVVWGRIFGQGDQLYLQTYVRFMRQGKAEPVLESLTARLKEDGTTLDLVGRLPSQATAFPSRRISRADLAAIDRKFREAMVVRKEKRLDAPGISIAFDYDRDFPYYVTRSDGDWIYIKPMKGGPEGWVLARAGGDGPDSFSLARWLPELAYIDAIAGFMRLKAAETPRFSASTQELRRYSAAVGSGFDRFERTTTAAEAPSAFGLARAVRGFVLWSDEGAGDRSSAARLFSESASLMPDYAGARNLAAITRPFLAGSPMLDAPIAARLNGDLLAAIALDPRDPVVLGNLDRLYRMYQARPGLSPYPAPDVASRIAALAVARKGAP